MPPPNSPVHDCPFEDSSKLQALDEIVHRDFSLSEDPNNATGGPGGSQPKRKLASNRRAGPHIGTRLPGETSQKIVKKLVVLLCRLVGLLVFKKYIMPLGNIHKLFPIFGVIISHYLCMFPFRTFTVMK